MKLSLVGRGPGWERAFGDQKDGREVWCVSTVFLMLKSVDVQPTKVFQLHKREIFERWIAQEQKRVVVMKPEPDFPDAIVLPAVQLLSTFGARFGSSFAWMLGLALIEGFTDISIHGIHVAHESEYGDQRDTFFWFEGLARGKGVKINIDEDSGVFIANRAYGFQGVQNAQS